jgi:hypothetical protein
MSGLTGTEAAAALLDVISEIRNRYDELTNSQKRIAETIVEDPEFLALRAGNRDRQTIYGLEGRHAHLPQLHAEGNQTRRIR